MLFALCKAVAERTGEFLARCIGDARITIHHCTRGASDRARLLAVRDVRQSPSPELGTWLPLAGSAAGRALADRQPCIVTPIEAVRPRYREEPLLASLGYLSLVSFPLVHQDRVVGTLDIAHSSREGLLRCCFQMLEQVACIVAAALSGGGAEGDVQTDLALLHESREEALPEGSRQSDQAPAYVAENEPMRRVIERVRLVAPSMTTVLIRGETGTGKEGLARLVHQCSPRFGAPFVVVNLGAIPDTLIESELFGHEKGAFTGAVRRRAGRFEQAEGGTIFLDEVGDAPPAVQVRLLRVLQERELQRVGGAETVRADVRVVAATNRSLEEMVKAGTFREDLYYRLAIFPIELPPLRERPEEIRPLASHLLRRHAALMHREPPQVPEGAWRALESHPWPGNVRELESFLQRSLILSPGESLILPDLRGAPPKVQNEQQNAVPRRWDEEVRDLIRRALLATGGKVYGPDGAAMLLGLPPTTLQGKMRKYGIAPGDS